MTAPDARRELAFVIVGCLAGAAAVLLAGGATWGRVQLELGEAIPPVTVELSGGDTAPLAVALGLLGLAAAAALVATKGVVRRVVGLVLALAGVAVIIDTLRAGGRLTALALDTSPGAEASATVSTPWPWLAVAGGLLLVAAGSVTASRGGRWRAMSQRYEAPGSARVAPASLPGAAAADPDAAWRALDRGEDPTV